MIEQNDLINFLKAIASETRQTILLEVFLDGQAHTVSEVANYKNISLSTASTHLSILKREKILSSEKIGKEVYYTGNREYLAEVFQTLANRFNCC